MEAGKRKPRLVPEEDQIRLDGQTLLHHAFDVVDDAVERAVGQRDHLDPVDFAGSLSANNFDLISRSGTAPYMV